MLRWLKAVVVSDVEKAHVMRQVGDREDGAQSPFSWGSLCDVSFLGIRYRLSFRSSSNCSSVGVVDRIAWLRGRIRHRHKRTGHRSAETATRPRM